MYVSLLLNLLVESWRWSCCGNTKNYLHKYPRCQLCVVACKVTEAHKMAPLPLPLPPLLMLMPTTLWHVRDCTFFSQPFSECAKWAWLSNANVRLSACLALCVCVRVCLVLLRVAVYMSWRSDVNVMAAKVFNFPLNCFQLSKESSLVPHTHTHTLTRSRWSST